jgi:hypothetical protein
MTISKKASRLSGGLLLTAVLIGIPRGADAQVTIGREPPPSAERMKPLLVFAGPVYSGHDIRLKIETSRSTFRAGDRIDVRLTLENQSDHVLKYTRTPLLYQARLRVFDAEGREVKRIARQPIFISHAVPDSLTPRGTKILTDAEGREWFNLLDWSYDLRAPGTYTIVGIPLQSSPKLTRDTTIRSNRLRITITQ